MRVVGGLVMGVVLAGCEARGPGPAKADAEVPVAPRVAATDAGGAPCAVGPGSWSPTVDGLRARLVTTNASREGVDVDLEVENTSGAAVELHWTGNLPLGFAELHLDDAAGRDVVPDWRFVGNSPSGDVRSVFPSGQTVRYAVHRGPFGKMGAARTMRIGAFWGRELPGGGEKRFLRATITAGGAHPTAPAYLGAEPAAKAAAGRAWSGALQVPAVCIE